MKYPGINSLLLHLPTLFFIAGCQIQPPSGTVIEPQTLGTVLDEVNLRQEENAEFAKFIVYQHEFEINLQQDLELTETDAAESSFAYEPEYRIRGHRLTPDGESHVRQIAYMITNYPKDVLPYVVIEQSNTSKRWDTKHRYPVHANDELDEIRRRVVVESLYAFGVENADELVVVAPAYPSGLNASEAAAAYQNSVLNSGPRNGGLFGR